MNKKVISIIIPMKNEAENVSILFTRIKQVLENLPIGYEIVVVNDGSTDETLSLLRDAQLNLINNLKIIDLSRSFGKEAAMYAGFANCSGDCAVAIDADLQDPPELIATMVEHWLFGYEVVTAVRIDRKTDNYFKRKSAGLFYKLINKMSSTILVAHAGDFRLLDRKAVNAFLELGARVRFNKGLLTWIGFKEKLVYHKRDLRVSGTSKWKILKLFDFAVDGITSFSNVILDLWFYLGVIITTLSGIYALYYFVKVIFFGIDVHGYPSLLLFILFFSGLQITGIGILGKYIGRIFIESKRRPLYIVRDVIENKPLGGDDIIIGKDSV